MIVFGGELLVSFASVKERGPPSDSFTEALATSGVVFGGGALEGSLMWL